MRRVLFYMCILPAMIMLPGLSVIFSMLLIFNLCMFSVSAGMVFAVEN